MFYKMILVAREHDPFILMLAVLCQYTCCIAQSRSIQKHRVLDNWVIQRIPIAACLYRLVLPAACKMGAAFSSVAQGPYCRLPGRCRYAWTTKAQDVQRRPHLHLQKSQLHHGQGHAMTRHDHDVHVNQGLLLCAQGVAHCQ